MVWCRGRWTRGESCRVVGVDGGGGSGSGVLGWLAGGGRLNMSVLCWLIFQ